MTNEFRYGIFKQNDLLRDYPKSEKVRTVTLGQIVKIEKKLTDGTLVIRLPSDTEDLWETDTFSCMHDSNVLPVWEKIYPFLLSVNSPQERVKLVKNKSLTEKLLNLAHGASVGFTEAHDIRLGVVKFIGFVHGIGNCYGIELNEKRKGNNCNGSFAGRQYFSCPAGYGVFTTIERIVPIENDTEHTHKFESDSSEVDNVSHRASTNIVFSGTDGKPQYEEIVTKYGEYPKKALPHKNTNLSYFRNSLSLQNIVDVGNLTVNTNNDFDQNTIIQPEKTYLMKESKPKNKSEMDLIDIIGGSWAGTTDSRQLESFSNLKKNLDKNDNIKEKFTQIDSNNFGVKSQRNKSMNLISHLLDGNNSLRRSKFYINEPENSEEHKIKFKKHDSKKINEKNEQTKSSTFYVDNDKPKYHDPQLDTTNELVIGSLVEVQNDISDIPLYGVVRWLGVENGTNFVLVGVELEEEQSHLPLTLTNGTHNGDRFFSCPENRALFVPLQQCHKDSRFQDGTPTPVHQATPSEVMECRVIPGAVAPLCMPTEEDVEAVCGKYRGIQGHHNSCYLDVTLFSMFTYTAVFDSLLFRPKNVNDIDDYEEVQRVLREEIVNPLRKNLFVSADHVMKLRKLLDKLSSVSGLTSEEKDPEEFLNSLLAQILKAEPFLKLNSGQEAFHYQLFVEKDADLTLPTVQQLFEQSFLTSNIKLKEVPSCLIIQMPRFGKNYKMYPRILPSQLLDVTDIIEGSPRQCTVCGKLARWECQECFDDYSSAGLESTAFCSNCLRTAHKHDLRRHHKPTQLQVPHDFSIMEDHCRPPRLFMELFAVICIETSHYVAFVKCGVGHEAPWCFFDSMADRKGERNGYNIPEMVACPDISRWLADEKICRQLHEEFPVDRHLPEHARRLLCDAYICMYQSSDVMMYR